MTLAFYVFSSDPVLKTKQILVLKRNVENSSIFVFLNLFYANKLLLIARCRSFNVA